MPPGDTGALTLQDAAASHGARLTVDLAAIAENWRRIARQAPQAECAAVVKADAYGCGLDRVAPALGQAGCRTFFVAHLAEALAARAVLPEATLYVLNGLVPGSAAVYREAGLRPVLGDVAELTEWAAASEGALPAALHVDTGMNRLGLTMPDALALAGDPLLTRAGIRLVMSHLVNAEDRNDSVNARQIAEFARVRAALPDLPGSLAASSGIFLWEGARHDLLRPGYALFGGNPIRANPPGERTNPMRLAVRLEAPIVQIREVAAGESAGYAASWTAPGPRRLATLSLGYADGYPRAASNRGHALVEGVLCPIVGQISMDLTILDCTDAPGARRGGSAVLIGDGLDLETVARSAGMIGYEVLAELGSRYVRVHVE